MKWSISQLPWLPIPSADFRAQCGTVAALPDRGAAIQSLAGQQLSVDQLIKLSGVLESCRVAGHSLNPLTPLKLAVLGNATTSGYLPCLPAVGARYGFDLRVVHSDYDLYVQEALDPGSAINQSGADLILLSLDYRAYPLQETRPGDRDAESQIVEQAMQHLQLIRAGLAQSSHAPVIFQTLALQPQPSFGNIDASVPGTRRSIINALNARIRMLAESTTDYLLDVAALAETVGLESWHDPVQWNLYKLPFSQQLVPAYADYVVRLLAAIRGKSRKCLVLDLDNTLWGGVIGDDGLEGIVLGQGSGLGEAFLDLQKTILTLRSQGIVLAVCSKNDDHVARLPFREHPEMLIKEDHIAVFQANWADKATNIEAIAQALDIGLDSLVFLDDNPFERTQVRTALPMVAVPELPEDPAYFARTLLSAGYFEAISFTDSDALRADQYQANAKRKIMLSEGRDLSSYIQSLQMEISCTPFDDIGRSRITQLINKTNQFNLTTRRYTEADVQLFQNRPEEFFTLQVRVKDIFGDQGMVSIIICRRQDNSWEIDTWLMSCRVLGRRVENEVFEQVVAQARQSGASYLTGRHIPSNKNGMVTDHYRSLGFSLIETHEDGSTTWQLAL